MNGPFEWNGRPSDEAIERARIECEAEKRTRDRKASGRKTVYCSCDDPFCDSHPGRSCWEPADYDVNVFDKHGDVIRTTSVCHSCMTNDMEQITEATDGTQNG